MPGAAAKRKGTHNEHRSMAYLEAAGYRCTRSGSSLGCWDLIGVSPLSVVLIQVKTNRWPGTAEMRELRDFAAPASVQKLIHRWNNYAQVPVVREVS